jgi:Cupin domain
MYLVIRGPGNLHVPRHWHSSNESITVLKGTFVVAHDGSEDKISLRAGGFAYMPAKMIHEAWTGDEGATYFITVDGKWDITQLACALAALKREGAHFRYLLPRHTRLTLPQLHKHRSHDEHDKGRRSRSVTAG